MSMIEAYFLDSINKKRYYFDEWGEKKEVESANKNIDCRVEYVTQMIKDENGNDIISSAIILMNADEDILFNDEITLDNKQYTVKKIAKGRAFDEDHLEIYL